MAKKTASKKSSSKRSSSKRSSSSRRGSHSRTSKLPGTSIEIVQNLTPFEQECVNFVQNIIQQYKLQIPGTYQHIGHAVAAAYQNAHVKNPQCSEFYTAEKTRKLAEREARRKAKKERIKAKRSASKKA